MLAGFLGCVHELLIDRGAVWGLILKPPEIEAPHTVGTEGLRQFDGTLQNFFLLPEVEIGFEVVTFAVFRLGAPGKSTLNSGLAMSVTRSLYFSSMRRASAISLGSRLRMFLFHIPRSSIHRIPNSHDATSQERPKSCEISSLITAMRKGDFAVEGSLSRSGVAGADLFCGGPTSCTIDRTG